MKKSIIITITLVLVGLLAISGKMGISRISAVEEVPKLINYQGKLTDNEGNPLTGDFSMTFAIYDAEDGGNLLWEEGPRDITVSGGLFSVLLGEVNPISLEAFDGDSVWMEIADNAITMPKIANNAVISAKISDGSVANDDLANNAVDSDKIKDGEVTSADIKNGTVTGTDIANETVTRA